MRGFPIVNLRAAWPAAALVTWAAGIMALGVFADRPWANLAAGAFAIMGLFLVMAVLSTSKH